MRKRVAYTRNKTKSNLTLRKEETKDKQASPKAPN